MRNRGPFTRALSVALVVWFGLITTEPIPLDACPMHGVHSLSARYGAASHAVGHNHGGAPDKSASHQCTCLGDCNSAGKTAALASDAVRLAIAGSVGAHDAVFFRHDAAPKPARFLLPFANGPPAGMSAA